MQLPSNGYFAKYTSLDPHLRSRTWSVLNVTGLKQVFPVEGKLQVRNRLPAKVSIGSSVSSHSLGGQGTHITVGLVEFHIAGKIKI